MLLQKAEVAYQFPVGKVRATNKDSISWIGPEDKLKEVLDMYYIEVTGSI